MPSTSKRQKKAAKRQEQRRKEREEQSNNDEESVLHNDDEDEEFCEVVMEARENLDAFLQSIPCALKVFYRCPHFEEEVHKLADYIAERQLQGGGYRTNLNGKTLRRLMPVYSEKLQNYEFDTDSFEINVQCCHVRSYLSRIARYQLGETVQMDDDEIDELLSYDTIMAKYISAFLSHPHLLGLKAADMHPGPEDDQDTSTTKSSFNKARQDMASEMFRSMCNRLKGKNLHIEDLASGNFCKLLIEVQYQKHAESFDRIIYENVEGMFLHKCMGYWSTKEGIGAAVKHVIKELSGHMKGLWEASYMMIEQIHAAASAVQLGSDQPKITCWECKRVCTATIYSCTKCNVAKYCGKDCQHKAWSLGHRHKCRNLPKKYGELMESFDLVVAVQEGVDYYNLVTNEESDLKSMGRAILTMSEIKECMKADGVNVTMEDIKGLKGPSMKYFYANLQRIQANNWWIHDVIPSAIIALTQQYETTTTNDDPPPPDDPQQWQKYMAYHFLMGILCYNLVDFFSAKAREMNKTYDYEAFSAGLLFIIAKRSRIIPKTDLAGVGRELMSRAQFLEGYRNDKLGMLERQDWDRKYRRMKQFTLGLFRQHYHR